MVDPRIYRALLVLVAFAVIVFGFSLKSQQSGVRTSLATGQYFSSAYTTMSTTLDQPKYWNRLPGSVADDNLAAYVRDQFTGPHGIGGYQVTTQEFTARTAVGTRILTNVIASKAGSGSGEVVVIAHRDATGPGRAIADLSGSVVLLDLARALGGESLDRSVVLIWTSGQVGAAGATELAHTLSLQPQPVDAVIALGDLAGAVHRSPEVVGWSGDQTLAPAMLRNTLAAYLSADAGIKVRGTGLGGQFVRLALPFAQTEQAPFLNAGIPAVLLSVYGDTPAPAGERLAPAAQIGNVGNALLQAVNALDESGPVPAPSSYLLISGKVVPVWAVRLLLAALILPVGVTAIDALARTRRRGHSLSRWLAWVLCGSVPFLAGLCALLLARVAHLFSADPPGAVGSGLVHMTGGDVAILAGVLLVVILAFVFLRPFCLRLLASVFARGARSRRHPETPAADAAAVALTLVACAVVLGLGAVNPYSALLLVPALHCWLWLAQPGMRTHRWAVLLLTVVSVLPALLVLIYYANAYGLTPLGLVWSGTLMVAGGAMPVLNAVLWALSLGCLASAAVIASRATRAAAAALDPIVTVRGPTSYAGPGSLGGTESALRR